MNVNEGEVVSVLGPNGWENDASAHDFRTG